MSTNDVVSREESGTQSESFEIRKVCTAVDFSTLSGFAKKVGAIVTARESEPGFSDDEARSRHTTEASVMNAELVALEVAAETEKTKKTGTPKKPTPKKATPPKQGAVVKKVAKRKRSSE
jgi:hypothetical protein